MSASQRRKGASAENELAILLGDWLGITLKRQLGQERDGGADIRIGRAHIQVKRCEDCGPNDLVWVDGKPANLEAAAAGALETIADLTDECTTFRYELARAIAQRDDEGDRLDWLMMNLAGNVTRGLLGELAHTGDPSEFRELIDEMRGERGQCVRRMPDNRICGLRAASCPSCAPAVHKVPQWRP